ncbi:MAG: FGGY-family carbohydrate kinase [Spirochaetia bacterium]|jgi:xylulokinase
MMTDPLHVLAYDIGTTSAKTCLFALGSTLQLLGSASQRYPLRILPFGGAEQDPDDWWNAMRATTSDVLSRTGVSSESVGALSFCCQMQGLVLVDAEGRVLRPAMSYMDQRAVAQWSRGIGTGLRVAGLNARKLLLSLLVTGGASASVKDPVWKYAWVKENEPEVFRRIHAWLDVKEYLLLRCTGNALMTEDSAHVTFLYDTRPGRRGWSRRLLRSFDVEPDHMPRVVPSTASVGSLTPLAAQQLGLKAGTPVIGGGGDVTMMAVGCGCVAPGDTHVYVGTSGWVSQVVQRRVVDLDHFIGSVLAARSGFYNYVGEQETSGKCLEWVRDHLALDEIGVYLEGRQAHDRPDSGYATLLEYLDHVIQETKAGSGGIIFTPWLHGNRSPFEDPNARGMFFNIGLETGKRNLIRAVVEGIAYHKRWILECMEEKTFPVEKLRFAGGGAISDSTSQILADVTGKRVEAVESPQNAGAAGAALLCGIARGRISSFEAAAALVSIRKTFEPDAGRAGVYARGFEVFKRLYRSNKESFALLNAPEGSPADRPRA